MERRTDDSISNPAPIYETNTVHIMIIQLLKVSSSAVPKCTKRADFNVSFENFMGQCSQTQLWVLHDHSI